jgi:hypothetical protein
MGAILPFRCQLMRVTTLQSLPRHGETGPAAHAEHLEMLLASIHLTRRDRARSPFVGA